MSERIAFSAEELAPHGARVAAAGKTFVTVAYESHGSVSGISQVMRRHGYELVGDHQEIRHLDFMLPTTGLKKLSGGGKPSWRALATLTLVFFGICVSAFQCSR